MATLEEIKELLGEPRFLWSDPEPWNLLEQELGITFPADFRSITDAYGPVLISDRLYLDHPGHPSRNLGRSIKEEIEFWVEDDVTKILPGKAGTRPGELLPIATGATAESVFLRVPPGPSAPWVVGIQEMDSFEFELYEMTFSDWLLAFLKGEDVLVGASPPARLFYEPLT
ncbi:SMI1/KNR4 family protein [Streptomyces uncialis]|uniref:SMI1/KNR4 family protein n=1 Tax=Streptomyces uncialis TaxID=1048205 RepID=UPI00225AA071|nr:SMI1/KNR4 family protein [Streptomyces uncialis]MCX4662065.1 SMI1/KNR4 family protein [Streptomyces uncialis]